MNDVTASVIDVYDTIAGSYAAQYSEDSSDVKWIDSFLSTIPKSGSVLDAGCGAGQHTKYMQESGFAVTGIDLSDGMLAVARKHFPAGKFMKMNLKALDFPAATFDGILSSYSLIHIQSSDVPAVLSEFYRVLKDGGHLAVFAQKGESDHIVDEPFAPGKKIFFNFFTTDGIRSLLESAGFSDISVTEEHTDDAYNMSDTNLNILAAKR